MNGFLNKKINHRIKNWLAPVKYAEMQSKNAVRNQYTNLYAYAANNPVHYIDPDGRKINQIISHYHMTGYTNEIPKTNPKEYVNSSGCAITLDANVAYTAGVNNVSPGDIASDDDNFAAGGIILWNRNLPNNVSTTGSIDSPFTFDMYDEYDSSATEYYIGIRVKYKGSSSNPSNSPHWVGVNGKYTDENGNQYFIISATSDNDSSLGTNPSLNNRGGLGWKNIEGVGTVVPVERVSGYIVFEVE